MKKENLKDLFGEYTRADWDFTLQFSERPKCILATVSHV